MHVESGIMVNRILNVLVWVGLVLVGAAFALGRVPALARFGDYARPLALAGLVCVLAYSASQWRDIARLFSGRQARYGTLSGVSVLVVLGILVAVNYIGSRQVKRWDLTTNKQFGLSDQSLNVISKLDAPLQMLAFERESDVRRLQDRLKEYQYGSKQISIDYIDPDKKPTVAKQNQVEKYGTIVMNYKGRTERVTTDTEQDVTNAIIKVVSGQQRKVYFTQGHGEKDIAGTDRESYSAIVAALGRENYATDKVVLAQQGSVPDDASVVIVAGPKADFFPQEIDALKKYLEKAGKLLLLLDPPDTPDSPPVTHLIALAHDWGMDLANDVVVDASGMGQFIGTDASVPVAASYPSHAITRNGEFRMLTAYPLARSVTPVSGGVNGHNAQGFVETSPRSWAETDIKALMTTGKVALDEAKDKKGPVTIGAAVSAATTAPANESKPDNADAPKPEARVAVIGDSDFPANSALGIQGNRDLFMNTVGWLSQQENLISIRPKEPDDRRITLTATQQSNILWLSLLIVPGSIFGAGVYNWWRRR
jgi:ABC-type uncharacterized transport system involved in gliding motility auxiliary subunit